MCFCCLNDFCCLPLTPAGFLFDSGGNAVCNAFDKLSNAERASLTRWPDDHLSANGVGREQCYWEQWWNHGETQASWYLDSPFSKFYKKNWSCINPRRDIFSEMDRTSEVVGLGRGMLGCDLDFKQNMDKHMSFVRLNLFLKLQFLLLIPQKSIYVHIYIEWLFTYIYKQNLLYRSIHIMFSSFWLNAKVRWVVLDLLQSLLLTVVHHS